MRAFLFAVLLALGVAYSGERTTIVPAPSPAPSRSPSPAPRAAPSAPARSSGASPPVIIRRREVPVPQPGPTPQGALGPAPRPVLPSQDHRGVRFQARAAQAPPQHTTIVRDPGLVREIHRLRPHETRPDFFFWHTYAGFPYCHYLDRAGLDWYGFYSGADFYWSRYYGGRWWWYDPGFARWVFWWDGYWWWRSPEGASYVFVENNYYPYQSDAGGITVTQPQMDQPPPAPPPSSSAGQVYNSPDGKRFVQVLGPRKEAFLYDRQDGQEVFLKYLAKDVADARFTTGEKGIRLRLDFSDGSYALYDADGRGVE